MVVGVAEIVTVGAGPVVVPGLDGVVVGVVVALLKPAQPDINRRAQNATRGTTQFGIFINAISKSKKLLSNFGVASLHNACVKRLVQRCNKALPELLLLQRLLCRRMYTDCLQTAGIPAAAQRLYENYGGHEPLTENLRGQALVRQ
jgi:hypothetical protein